MSTPATHDGPQARVSVLIPTFNRARFLRSAIRSVLEQDYRDLRLVVVDDASTDDTPDVVASFSDPRITYRRQPRNLGGWLANSNSAFEGVATEFVVWLGDDDQMLPGALGRAVAAMDRHPNVGIVHAAFNYVNADGAVLVTGTNLTRDLKAETLEPGHTYIRKAMRYGTRVCSPAAMARTAAVPLVPFDPEAGPTADAGLWMRIALKWDVLFISEPGLNYRLHGGSDSSVWSRLAGDRYRPTVKLIGKIRWMKLRFLDTYGDEIGSRAMLYMIVNLATMRSLIARLVPNGVAARIRSAQGQSPQLGVGTSSSPEPRAR